jgi:[ribosomal protein S5]-alanine N-acetyltransferase
MCDYLLDKEETDRLVFRLIQTSDYEEWLEFFKDPETSRHWIMKSDDPVVQCNNWYKRQFERYKNNEGGMNALIEKASGKLIGHCGLLKQTVDHCSELEIGYSLLPAFWNKGYAKEAAQKCCDYAFQNHLSASLISIISVTNIQSEKVARKIGMTLDKNTVYDGNEVHIFRIKK